MANNQYTAKQHEAFTFGQSLAMNKDRFQVHPDGSATYSYNVTEGRTTRTVAYEVKGSTCTCKRAKLIAANAAKPSFLQEPMEPECLHCVGLKMKKGTLSMESLPEGMDAETVNAGYEYRLRAEREREQRAPIHVTLENIEVGPEIAWTDVVQVTFPNRQWKADGRANLPAFFRPRPGQSTELAKVALERHFRALGITAECKTVRRDSNKQFYADLDMAPENIPADFGIVNRTIVVVDDTDAPLTVRS